MQVPQQGWYAYHAKWGRTSREAGRSNLVAPVPSAVAVSAWRWNALPSVFLMHRHLQTLLIHYAAAVPQICTAMRSRPDTKAFCTHSSHGPNEAARTIDLGPNTRPLPVLQVTNSDVTNTFTINALPCIILMNFSQSVAFYHVLKVFWLSHPWYGVVVICCGATPVAPGPVVGTLESRH
jgi:hypothetical protein